MSKTVAQLFVVAYAGLVGLRNCGLLLVPCFDIKGKTVLSWMELSLALRNFPLFSFRTFCLSHFFNLLLAFLLTAFFLLSNDV